jgi:hypothetical protein
MSRIQKLLVFVAVIALTVLACSTTSGNGNNNDSGDSDRNNILFQDDFSSTRSGWDREDYGDAVTDYGDDIYRIQILTDQYISWSTPYQDFEDVVIEVETYKASGGDDNGFGIICRHEDVENFYFLEISSDGYAWIGKYYQAEFELLDSVEDADINLGTATNSLRAECVGNRLSLYANGDLLVETFDSDLTHGDVGLVAETYDSPSTEILFDNFIVTKP